MLLLFEDKKPLLCFEFSKLRTDVFELIYLDLSRLCLGLELNRSKKEALWLGSNKIKTDTPFGVHWPKDYVNALGICCTTDQNICFQNKNLESILLSAERFLLFPIECFIYTLLLFPTNNLEFSLRSNINKMKRQILIKHKFRF